MARGVLQRRRGQTIVLHETVEITDNRGNKSRQPTGDSITIKAFVGGPARSSVAEVAGQAQIDLRTVNVDIDTPNIDAWSEIEFEGAMWDIVNPPLYHYGSPQHLSFEIRRRPS